MQFENTYMEDFYNNKENENINNEVFNINPKIKYPKTTKTNSYNNYNNFEDEYSNNRNEKPIIFRRESSLNLRAPNVDKQFRERRARSISFADISEFSNSNNNFLENNKYNVNRNYKMGNINNQKKSGNLTRNRSNSSLNGTTILAKKRSFRKPKVLISSKEHIRRLKKMKSSSAISFKNDNKNDKAVKRRYSIHFSPSPKLFSYDDDFYGDKFDESYSDLPPNNLYHELKQAREKELLQRKLENENNLEVVDEETVYYDSDSTLHNSNSQEVEDDENNGSLLKYLLKYLENSINKSNNDTINNTIEGDIEGNLSRNIMEREIKEGSFDDSIHSGSCQNLDEDSELHKQEELLESMFNDVMKNFYGYQTKFYYIIIKLISFLLYNGGKLEIGSHILKYILKDKLGISASLNDETSFTDTSNINHLENEEMEFITLHDIKENKKHEKRRRKGYKALNRFYMITHSVFIVLFLHIFLMRFHSNIAYEPSYVSNLRNANFPKNYKKYSGIDDKNKFYESDQNILWIRTTPVLWMISNNDNQIFINQCNIDEFTGNKVIVYNSYLNKDKDLENQRKFTRVLEKFTPWKSLILLECILFSAQFGLQYFIMDEIVPFFKPASYTSFLFINQIINFFIQYKIVWKILYNDLCLYIFIIGIYITFS